MYLSNFFFSCIISLKFLFFLLFLDQCVICILRVFLFHVFEFIMSLSLKSYYRLKLACVNKKIFCIFTFDIPFLDIIVVLYLERISSARTISALVASFFHEKKLISAISSMNCFRDNGQLFRLESFPRYHQKSGV